MSDCTVNIADFRCRAMKSRANIFRAVPAQVGLSLVESRRGGEIVSMSSGAQAGHPRVYDIGMAREAQRSRPRLIFRPISIQRHAKVIRFHEAPVHAAAQTAPRWTPPMNGPNDLPPAA